MALALSSGMAGPSAPGHFDDPWSNLSADSSLPGPPDPWSNLDLFDVDDGLILGSLFDDSPESLLDDDAAFSGLSSSSSDSESSSSGCSSPCPSLDGSCHTLEHPTAEEDATMEVGPAAEQYHPAVSSSRGGSQLQWQVRQEAINTTITAATAAAATTTTSRRGAGSAVVRGQRQGARPSSRRAKKRRTTTRTTTTAAAAAAAAHQHMAAATAAGSISPCQHSQEGADGLEVEPAARKPSLGGHLQYKGHHDCRWPRCKSKYRWPDYLCGKHGGGRCQIDFYWPGHPPCDKYHQSKNAKGKLLCGAHCTQMDQATYGDKMRQGRP